MKVSQATELVLQRSQAARDSDNELRLQVLDMMGANLTEWQKSIFRRTNMESVRRTRQKLQEQGKYPASEFVKGSRKFKDMQIQQMITTTKAEKTDDLIDATPKAIPWMD